jgi:hypothetical protein
VPHDADNNQLCAFYDDSGSNGYLNYFLDNNAHPIIELKNESVLSDNPIDGCMKINPAKVNTFIGNILTEIKEANEKNSSLISRCYFVSFFDDLLTATIDKISLDPGFSSVSNRQFQKLLDDGGVGAYILSDSYANTTPGSKVGSGTNFKNYERYVDGS